MSDSSDGESRDRAPEAFVATVTLFVWLGLAVLLPATHFVIATAVLASVVGWAALQFGVLSDDEPAEPTDPLATLQERYAAGELSEAEFERRLDRIMDSEQQLQAAANGDRSPTASTDRTELLERE